MGDDWTDQSVQGCKGISPGYQMRGVSSLFTLIAPRGKTLSPTAVSRRAGDVPVRSPERM